MQLNRFAALSAIGLAAMLAVGMGPAASEAGPGEARSRRANVRWPEGTHVLEFENLEGVILVECKLNGIDGRDTSGVLAVDTGAGYLALDHGIARRLGIGEGSADQSGIDFAAGVLPRLELGPLQIDQVSPVLMIDMEVVRRVTDRPVLGLVGERLLSSFAVLVDYSDELLALIPVIGPDAAKAGAAKAGGEGTSSKVGSDSRSSAAALLRMQSSRSSLASVLTANAKAIPFELEGDGKMLVDLRVSSPRPPRYSRWLNFIIDTGATKCVLFEESLDEQVPTSRAWPALKGLAVPTLLGTSGSRLVRIPSLQISAGSRRVEARDVDAAVIRSELSQVLSRVVSRPVHGLLGYSFLKRYRIVIDYPHRVMWLAQPTSSRDARPYEYSHVGLQLERADDGAIRVLAVAEGSPAAAARIDAGDEIISVDGRPVGELDIASIIRGLEGRPGTSVRLTVCRGAVERSLSLIRRRLL